MCTLVYVWVNVCARVCVCVRACVRACVRVHACVRACVFECWLISVLVYQCTLWYAWVRKYVYYVTECICTFCLCCWMYFGCVALSVFFRVCTSVDILRMRYVL